MKTNYCMILAIASLLLLSPACEYKKPVPESLIGIKETVAKLDSSVNSMYGWEPRDSTYNNSVDTLVSDIMESIEKARPNITKEDKNAHAITQESYDQARTIWNKFKKMIDNDQYEKALEVYWGNGKKNDKIAGDFMVFLKHSIHRFVFFSEVLLPMMIEYKGEDVALDEYINLLKFEKAIDDLSISTSEKTGYIPEIYPNIITELGLSLVKKGKMDEAQELFNDFTKAIYLITNDALYANFSGTYYAAKLYLQDNKPLWALGTWDNFLDYLEENKTDFDPDELKECIKRIEDEKAKIH